jgi:tetratricopeptide (TPR) repeat protein
MYASIFFRLIFLKLFIAFTFSICAQSIDKKGLEGIYYGNLKFGQSVFNESICLRFYEDGLVLGLDMKYSKLNTEILSNTFTKENKSKFPFSNYELNGSKIHFQLQICGKFLTFVGNVETNEKDGVIIVCDAYASKKEKYEYTCSRIWKEKIPEKVIENKGLTTSQTNKTSDKTVKDKTVKNTNNEPVVESKNEPLATIESVYKKVKDKQYAEAIFELNKLGVQAYSNAGYEEALDYFDEAIELAKFSQDSANLAILYNNKGACYQLVNEHNKAIENYQIARNIFSNQNKKRDEGKMLNTIANAFKELLNFKNERNYLIELISLEEKGNLPNELAATFNNLAINYYHAKSLDSSLIYIDKAIETDTKNNNKSGLAIDYNNKGNIYFEKGDYASSLTNYNQSITIKEEIQDVRGTALTHYNVGNVFLKQNQIDSAKKHFEISLELAKSSNFAEVIYSNYLSLSAIKSADINCNESLDFYKNYTSIKYTVDESAELKQLVESRDKYIDELTGDAVSMLSTIEMLEAENSTKLVSLSHLQEEIRKKELFVKLEIEKLEKDAEILASKNELLTTNVELEKVSNSRKTMVLWGLGALGLLLFVFLGVTIRNARKIKQSRDEIQHQKLEIEEKNGEIIQSITYAKRLQEAILPPLVDFQHSFIDSFVLYEPKDIVAGDFYWLETYAKASVTEGDNLTTPLAPSNGGGMGVVYFAAADCTGHGVPGAMVSVICSNALSKALLEEGITETGKLLDRTRELVIERFAKSGDQVKDGMDISLCKLTGNILEWSGANNPLWVVSKNTEGGNELREFKPDKQPIGNYAEPKPFTTHTIQLAQGDSIYIFTDGYADQFGGPKGKKFMYKPFKELLLSIQNLSMDEQKNKLEKQFNDWKGPNEQIDDVCIIGVKLH